MISSLTDITRQMGEKQECQKKKKMHKKDALVNAKNEPLTKHAPEIQLTE